MIYMRCIDWANVFITKLDKVLIIFDHEPGSAFRFKFGTDVHGLNAAINIEL